MLVRKFLVFALFLSVLPAMASVTRGEEIAVPGSPIGQYWGVELDSVAGEGTFSLLSGPSWATLTTDGLLAGTPDESNVGENRWEIRVTTSSGDTEYSIYADFWAPSHLQ